MQRNGNGNDVYISVEKSLKDENKRENFTEGKEWKR